MIAELGHFALALALAVAAAQAFAGLGADGARLTALGAVARRAALLQAGLVGLAFLLLMRAYVVSDFSVRNVYENSHSLKPMLYKVSGVWGNHEGSMVLWVLILAVLGAAVALAGRNLRARFEARVLGVQGLLGLGFLAFVLFTSNPFLRLDPAPLDGQDLNPLLQDPGLAFHPPFLYLGYVGFSVAFSFAVAALLEGRVDPAWARWVRPWTLLAWASLTVGIGMGSWWAYYELGWGGWWFWDPVENASLMPWLTGTALLHSAIVVEKRDTLKRWTILMAIVTFSSSLLGTFLVRSGALSSVHAFAASPERGLFILALIVLTTGGALALYARRGAALAPGGAFAPISRESALVLNNVILTVLFATVLIGTLFPLFARAAFGATLTVGPPYFNTVTTPLGALLVGLVAVGALLPWKRAELAPVFRRLAPAAGLTLAIVLGATWLLGGGGPVIAPLAIGLGAWAILGALTDIAQKLGLFRAAAGPGAVWARARGLPMSHWGTALAHGGAGIAILGMTGTSLLVSERIEAMRPGETLALAGYELRFEGLESGQVANYEVERGRFTILKGGKAAGIVEPERRWYPVTQTATTEAGIAPRWFSDIYVALGDPVEGGGRVVRAYHHPLVHLLWGGIVVMGLGGLLSLADRRYRVGAPRPSPARSADLASAQAAAARTAAE